MTVEVELRNVGMSYPGGVEALRDVSLRVEPGEFMVLVGPSGCGKSTLLRLVAGLEEPTSGEITVGGRIANGLSPKERDVAMVFQSYALYPHMTVAENMGFGLRLRKRPKAEIRERVMEAASILGLEELLDRRPATLSGGQRQRVAMGRAIVRHPAAFLMDEPLSNLDAQLRVAMRAELRQLHQRLGVTTLYVTHDQVEAMTLGDRVAALAHGRLQQEGTPEELFARPSNLFVATFIGSPPMNLLTAQTANGSLSLAGASVAIPRQGLPAEVIVGLRPTTLEDAAFAQGEELVTIDVVAEVVEHLGEEKHVLFRWPDGGGIPVPRADQPLGNLLIARVDARSHAQVGAPLQLCFRREDLYLFDRDSGLAL